MSCDSPHYVTMHFDMTTEDGWTAYEYARLGEKSHDVIFKLWDEMCNHQNDCRGPDQITGQWLQRLLEIIDELNVPLEV